MTRKILTPLTLAALGLIGISCGAESDPATENTFGNTPGGAGPTINGNSGGNDAASPPNAGPVATGNPGNTASSNPTEPASTAGQAAVGLGGSPGTMGTGGTLGAGGAAEPVDVPPPGMDPMTGPGGAPGAGGAANPDPIPPDPTPVPPLRQPTGFASTNSSGLPTTTGGGNLAPTSVTSCTELDTLLSDATPRVLEIPSGTTLDCRSVNPGTVGACQLLCSATSTQTFFRVPVTGQDCTTLADFNGDGTLEVPPGTLVTRPRSDFRIDVGSNKTLRGAGSGATLLGVSLNIDGQSNIIVQNLNLGQINPDLIEAGDGLTINTSHHVWVDHNSFSMISDGYMDIRFGSSAVTISNNRFDGRNPFVCGGQHNFISLVSDSEATYDHNYFDHVGGRNPKVDGVSTVHIYSNFYDSVSFFCANSGVSSALLVESNYFLNSSRPHWAEGGLIEASGNVYAGTTSTDFRDNNADVFAPPYAYPLDNVANLPTAIPALVGPSAP